MNPFLDRIDPAKKRAGLTDKELAEKIGVNAKTISKWRHNGVDSYRDYIYELSVALNAPINYLLGYPDDKNPAPNDRDGLSDFDVSLLDFIHTLSADQLRGILLVLKAPAELLSALDREAPQG